MLPPELRPSYEDPQLWRRLGPEVERHYADTARLILEREVKTHDQYSNQMGYLAALRWVMDRSRSLNEAPPMAPQREEDEY